MNLKQPLELEIYWKNGTDCQLESLGIEVDYIPETRPMMFYSVDYISSGEPQGVNEEKGFISSGGEEFATTLSYDELKNKIKFHL